MKQKAIIFAFFLVAVFLCSKSTNAQATNLTAELRQERNNAAKP